MRADGFSVPIYETIAVNARHVKPAERTPTVGV